jgi:lipopolysaccharide export system protein LptA
MKRYSLVVIAVGCSLMIRAQTNTPGTPSTPRGLTHITAQSGDFDLAGQDASYRAVYRGHVRVDDPQMKLTCEQLVADVPQASGRPNRIVAETNVVIDFTDEKGQTNHATGDKAVYVYSESGGVTNETITLTGNPQMENARGTQAGDVIVLDRANNKVHIDNPNMISRQNLTSMPASTNPPVTMTKTNIPPGTVENTGRTVTNPPVTVVKTNFPPGTIENIDKNIVDPAY